MIQVIPADSRYSAKSDWLESNFSFSFGPYYDTHNTSFGPMRVLNDDFIAPSRGFGAHPHSDMEVVSIVLTGALRHQDNLGNVGVTSWGEIQRMTAGTGIIHTEANASKDETLNLLQMWFMPERRGLDPSYEITSFDTNALGGNWLPVVSTNSSQHVSKIHQDMTIYLTELDVGESIPIETTADRRTFLFVIEGQISLNNDDVLHRRDSARIINEPHLSLKSGKASRVMWIDLP